jgi:hypothetical protein
MAKTPLHAVTRRGCNLPFALSDFRAYLVVLIMSWYHLFPRVGHGKQSVLQKRFQQPV